MNSTSVAIIGGGLSGLYAALLLEQRGITDYKLFESRQQLGGRIQTLVAEDNAADIPSLNHFDLGPTWYWPELQPAFARLIDILGLTSFPQYEQGDHLIERSRTTLPNRFGGMRNYVQSRRLQGGMAALINAISRQIPPQKILFGHHLLTASACADSMQLKFQRGNEEIEQWQTQKLLLAVPPRLLERTVEFNPALPAPISRQWRTTPTWMAPHAKYIAVYDRPFWRQDGLSGAARSSVGPMVEIHDASMPGGKAALFGFIGIPAPVRQQYPEGMLLQYCREQLSHLFGSEALTSTFDAIKDWAFDPLTATAADISSQGDHPRPAIATIDSGIWANKVFGAASEWSSNYTGYLAGCIEAAETAVDSIQAQLNTAITDLHP